jgi:tetratricopeptide (TPR) repeat protein
MPDVSLEVAELLRAGFAAKDKGDFRVARALFQAAVAESKKKRDRAGEARSLLELSAVVNEFDKDAKAARKMLNDCLQIYTKLRSDRGRAYAMSNLGSIAFEEKVLEAAWKWQTEALALFEKEQDKYGIAMASHQIGKIKSQQKDFSSAEMYWRRSLLLFEGLGRNYAADQVLLSLGGLHLDYYKNQEQAKALFTRALTLFEEAGLLHEADKARHNLAIVERLESSQSA